MSKPRRAKVLANGRSVSFERHVRLHYWLLESAAYRSLSVGARSLLVELYALYNGGNNGLLFLSSRSAGERLRCSKSQAHRWLGELQDRGFIRSQQRGSFTLKARHATTWVLTEFGFGGQLPAKDFMKWRDQLALDEKAGPNGGPVRPREGTSPAHSGGQNHPGGSHPRDCRR